jgi:AcrR family transcriptional regulator
MEVVSLRERQQKLREDVILAVVNRLLAEKGYDLMTVDEVAAMVGIAKASLYKHFESKELLAAAAMVRLLDRTLDAMATLPPTATPADKLQGLVRWAVREHLRGEMPSLPSTRSALRETLVNHKPYIDRLLKVTEHLSGWIEAAQSTGALDPRLPAEAILYTIFARACDPVADFLQDSGAYSDEEIVDLIAATCFSGLLARPS